MTTTPAIPRYLADPQGYHRDQYQKRKQAIYDHLGGKCTRCAATENLQVDHTHRAEKSFNIDRHLSLKNPATLAELAKCQLLCRTCHEAKTAQEQTGFTHGSQYGWQKQKCPCALCQTAKQTFYEKRKAARRKPGGRGPYRPHHV